MPVLHNPFHKEVVKLNSLFNETSITVIPNPESTFYKKENSRPMFIMNRFKTPHNILANRIQQHRTRIAWHNQVGFVLGMQSWVNMRKINQCNSSHLQNKIGKSIIISTECRKII